MIVDLVRHDLGHVSLPGTVEVDHLCRVEEHPGLVHLVSDVSGDPAAGHDLALTCSTPASRPGRSAVRRSTPRCRPSPTSSRCRAGPYCGAVGWVDADRDEAELAVGIRTFWVARDDTGRRVLRFGTGAGITWGSDAEGEWRETELKAARLVALATGAGPGHGRCDA